MPWAETQRWSSLQQALRRALLDFGQRPEMGRKRSRIKLEQSWKSDFKLYHLSSVLFLFYLPSFPFTCFLSPQLKSPLPTMLSPSMHPKQCKWSGHGNNTERVMPWRGKVEITVLSSRTQPSYRIGLKNHMSIWNCRVTEMLPCLADRMR